MSGFVLPPGLIDRKGKSLQFTPPVRLDYRRFGIKGGAHVTELPEYRVAAGRVILLQELLRGESDRLKDGEVVMTGWKTESPAISTAELDKIKTAANKLASMIDIFCSIGIGGSFLGAKAGIEAIKGSLELTNLMSRAERKGSPPMTFFLGQNMDPRYVAAVLEIMRGKEVGGCVISKSGTTVEPAIAFAILEAAMKNSYSTADLVERIVAITDAHKGALKDLAKGIGYNTSFTVPDNVGGRFSVTSPVGLFPLAVAGVDIHAFIAGARYAEDDTRAQEFESNIAMQIAVMRYLAHKVWGKATEVYSTGVYDLKSTLAWFQQLAPESEGKNGEGLFVAPEFYTEMAHANGQLIKMGPRNLIETFLMVEDPGVDVNIPGAGTPVAYLDGKPLSFANQAFIDGLRDDHYEGGVPTMSVILPQLNAFTIGAYFQYMMNAVALSGLLLNQNPFIQPGVQGYKDVANARSGKPGTEAALAKMLQVESGLNPGHII